MILSVLFVHAQKETKNTVEPEEFKTIKMPKFPNADFPKKSIAVSDIQIIQAVRDSVRLGYTLKGLDNHIATMRPSKPLTEFLQDHVYKMYTSSLKDEGAKILWLVKDLRVGEKSAMMEHSYLRFNTDAYISRDGNLYKWLCTVDTVFVTESGADLTAWHGEDIENALKLLLKRTLAAAKNASEQSSGDITIEQILKNQNRQLDVPILVENNYQEGAYANFDEFLQNKPSIKNYQPVTIEKNTLMFTRIGENNHVDTITIWGLCRDKQIFKFDNGVLIPIEKQSNGFIISGYIQKANRRNSNIAFGAFAGAFGGGIAGGLTGALVASSSSGRMLLVKSIPYITKSSKQPEASCIDMKTGELSF